MIQRLLDRPAPIYFWPTVIAVVLGLLLLFRPLWWPYVRRLWRR